MLEISNSVGTGAVNQPTDVAAVEALLCIVTAANGRPYMSSYDGAFAIATRDAITAFQQDNGIVPRPGAANAAAAAGVNPGAANPAQGNAVKDTAGVVQPQGPTIAKLNQMLPAQYKSVNIIPGGRTVYWEGSAALAASSATAIRADGTLDATFRADVATLVDTMYSDYKLTMGLCGQGGLRTFQEQFGLATKPTGTNKAGQPTYATGAGPGESNHNYGMAVDLGFIGFKWLGPTAAWISEGPWLKKLQTTNYAKFEHFWNVRNALIPALGLNLYDTLYAGDFVHLQNFDDKHTNMRHSLVQLLNTVGSMKWTSSGQIYSCDFGLGGAFYPVGKSEEIWDQKATVTAATLTKAWKAAGKTVQAKAQDETDMKQWLREEFDRAENNRSSWVAVP